MRDRLESMVSRYLLPAFMVGLLIAVMVGINRGAFAIADYMGGDFAFGFLAGGTFCGALYYIIRWLEPSRPDR